MVKYSVLLESVWSYNHVRRAIIIFYIKKYKLADKAPKFCNIFAFIIIFIDFIKKNRLSKNEASRLENYVNSIFKMFINEEIKSFLAHSQEKYYILRITYWGTLIEMITIKDPILVFCFGKRDQIWMETLIFLIKYKILEKYEIFSD